MKLASPYMTLTEAGLRPTVAVAVSRRDWAALSRYVSWRWSVDILPQVLGNAIPCGVVRKAERLVAADLSGHGAWHSAASWDSWLKNRLVEIRSFLPGEPANFAQLRMGVTLHVGFLSIEETEEHLERLRNEKVVESPGPSTPGIERCQTVVGPIDRTSARVVAASGVGQ